MKIEVLVSTMHQKNTDLINNDSGFLLSPYDCEGFAAAIKTILDDTCVGEKFVRNNLMSVKAFESNVIISKMSDLYRQ